MRQTPGWTDFVEILNGTYCTAKWNFWIVLGWRQRFRRYPCMEPKVLLEGWQSTTAIQSVFSTKLLPTYSFTCLGVCISMQVCTRAYECVCMPWCLCQGQRKISGVKVAFFFSWGRCVPGYLSYKNSPVSISHLAVGTLGLQMCVIVSSFLLVRGIWTQVLMLSQWALHLQNHLCRPVNVYFSLQLMQPTIDTKGGSKRGGLSKYRTDSLQAKIDETEI